MGSVSGGRKAEECAVGLALGRFFTQSALRCPHAIAREPYVRITPLMDRAGDFLGKVVRRLERPEAALAWLTAAWPSIVGKALAAHTRPVRCAAGRLEVTIDAKAWQKQLAEMTQEFCGRINQAFGSNLVREVIFTLTKTGPKRIPHEQDNDHTPFVRRKKGRAD